MKSIAESILSEEAEETAKTAGKEAAANTASSVGKSMFSGVVSMVTSVVSAIFSKDKKRELLTDVPGLAFAVAAPGAGLAVGLPVNICLKLGSEYFYDRFRAEKLRPITQEVFSYFYYQDILLRDIVEGSQFFPTALPAVLKADDPASEVPVVMKAVAMNEIITILLRHGISLLIDVGKGFCGCRPTLMELWEAIQKKLENELLERLKELAIDLYKLSVEAMIAKINETNDNSQSLDLLKKMMQTLEAIEAIHELWCEIKEMIEKFKKDGGTDICLSKVGEMLLEAADVVEAFLDWFSEFDKILNQGLAYNCMSLEHFKTFLEFDVTKLVIKQEITKELKKLPSRQVYLEPSLCRIIAFEFSEKYFISSSSYLGKGLDKTLRLAVQTEKETSYNLINSILKRGASLSDKVLQESFLAQILEVAEKEGKKQGFLYLAREMAKSIAKISSLKQMISAGIQESVKQELKSSLLKEGIKKSVGEAEKDVLVDATEEVLKSSSKSSLKELSKQLAQS